MTDYLSFRLPDHFIENYKTKPVNWGFDIGAGNSLSELTFIAKYSRKKTDGTKEQWYECSRRCVEGMYSILKDWCKQNRTPWNEFKSQKSAQEAYAMMFEFKWTPPGRGLANMGTEMVHSEQNNASLNNCAAISTEKLSAHSLYAATMPFTRLMEMSMHGVGVGFDTRGAGKLTIHTPDVTTTTWTIPDTREGWAESIQVLLETYFFKNRSTVEFDYSIIRPAGSVLKRFGGHASGPEPLKKVHEGIRKIFIGRDGDKITSRDIVDIMNMIGKAVVAGGARRSALIALGESTDQDYVNLKNWELPENAERTGSDGWAWTSNNSVFANSDDNLGHLVNKIAINGEPGVIYLDVMQQYGRLADQPNNRDYRANLVNPCQPAWAPVLTPNGISTIGELCIGDKIWSSEGWTTVINKWSTGVKPVYRYETTTGRFYGTENHRLVSNGVKVEAKDADSIDSLVGASFAGFDLDPQDVMDGLVLGDGSCHKASNNLVLLDIGKNDSDYFRSEIASLINKERKGIGPTVWEITTTLTHLDLPLLPGRVVPAKFFYSEPSKVAGFLRGLYSANGSVVNKGRRITLKTTSSMLLRQVQTMLSSLGINSYYTTNQKKNVEFSNGTYSCKESYDLNITKDRYKFVNLIGFIQKYKNDKITFSNKISSKQTYKITSVQMMSTEEVFDITVDNASHTYWTGGVNVSNCAEISLEPHEFCCLAELYPANNTSFAEFERAIKHAYMYAKSVTLMPSVWPETNEVITRNRRIGVSMTGIVEFLETRSWAEMKRWMDEGYQKLHNLDVSYSEWLGVRESIKVSTVKPAGTTSIIAGTTSGVHWPTTSGYYLRRQRFLKHDPIVDAIIEAGYHVEPDVMDPEQTVVATFPTRGLQVRSERQVSVWEKAHLAAMAQRYWADNMVSVTVSFDSETEAKEIDPLLRSLQGQLKSVSFLPISDKGTTYEQAPFEPISDSHAIVQQLSMKRFDMKKLYGENSLEAQGEKYCEADKCLI